MSNYLIDHYQKKQIVILGNIRKLRFNIEKCKVQHTGSKNIKDKYKLNNREIKNTNERLVLMIHLNLTTIFLSIVSRANKMIGWMVRNITSMEVNIVLKVYKILIRPHAEPCNQAWAPVSRHEN